MGESERAAIAVRLASTLPSAVSATVLDDPLLVDDDGVIPHAMVGSVAHALLRLAEQGDDGGCVGLFREVEDILVEPTWDELELLEVGLAEDLVFIASHDDEPEPSQRLSRLIRLAGPKFAEMLVGMIRCWGGIAAGDRAENCLQSHDEPGDQR